MGNKVKHVLDESEIPTQWYNIIPDLPEPPPPPLHPATPRLLSHIHQPVPIPERLPVARPAVGIGRVVDQQVAGLLMKLACGLILWTVITVILFRWASAERRDDMSNDFSSTGQW
jgi:hypothetical protein